MNAILAIQIPPRAPSSATSDYGFVYADGELWIAPLPLCLMLLAVIVFMVVVGLTACEAWGKYLNYKKCVTDWALQAGKDPIEPSVSARVTKGGKLKMIWPDKVTVDRQQPFMHQNQ